MILIVTKIYRTNFFFKQKIEWAAHTITLVAHRILGDYLVLHIMWKAIFLVSRCWVSKKTPACKKYDWTQIIPDESMIPSSLRVIKKLYDE